MRAEAKKYKYQVAVAALQVKKIVILILLTHLKTRFKVAFVIQDTDGVTIMNKVEIRILPKE